MAAVYFSLESLLHAGGDSKHVKLVLAVVVYSGGNLFSKRFHEMNGVGVKCNRKNTIHTPIHVTAVVVMTSVRRRSTVEVTSSQSWREE